MSNNATADDLIDVAPLREAFEASGLTPSTVARRLGWMKYSGHTDPDVTRLRRALGIAPVIAARTGARYTNQRIGYDLALLIARALNIDPVDVGL